MRATVSSPQIAWHGSLEEQADDLAVAARDLFTHDHLKPSAISPA
jgi:hypothetical protein